MWFRRTDRLSNRYDSLRILAKGCQHIGLSRSSSSTSWCTSALQQSPQWAETAVVILYDDSDGWYDHQMPPVVNPSFNPTVDTLNGAFGQPVNGRCGYGTRMPLLLVSPFAKRNFVDHTLTDQSSLLRFVEDN